MQPAPPGTKSFPLLPKPDPLRKATPLHYASSRGDFLEAESLRGSGADINATTRDGSTPLHLAAQQEHENVCLLLIKKGADVNARDEAGRTPLHIACYTCFSNTVVQFLIDKGADAKAVMKNKRNGLHIVVANQRPRLPFTQRSTNSPVVEMELEFAKRQRAICETLIRVNCGKTPIGLDVERNLHY